MPERFLEADRPSCQRCIHTPTGMPEKRTWTSPFKSEAREIGLLPIRTLTYLAASHYQYDHTPTRTRSPAPHGFVPAGRTRRDVRWTVLRLASTLEKKRRKTFFGPEKSKEAIILKNDEYDCVRRWQRHRQGSLPGNTPGPTRFLYVSWPRPAWSYCRRPSITIAERTLDRSPRSSQTRTYRASRMAVDGLLEEKRRQPLGSTRFQRQRELKKSPRSYDYAPIVFGLGSFCATPSFVKSHSPLTRNVYRNRPSGLFTYRPP